MAIYTANKTVKTLTVHKRGCRVIPAGKLSPCGCGDTGGTDSQRWFCEEHITLTAVEEYMNHRNWAILMCDLCFRPK